MREILWGLRRERLTPKRGKERVFATRGFAAFRSALLGQLFIDCCVLKEAEVDFVKQKIKQKKLYYMHFGPEHIFFAQN